MSEFFGLRVTSQKSTNNYCMNTETNISAKYLLGSEHKQLRFWLFIAVCFLSVISISRIIYPYDVGQYEAGIWAPSSLAANGNNPYDMSLTDQEPYTMSPYGIIYYVVVGLGIKLFGLQFWFARALSFLCAIVCSLCIAKLVYSHTKNSNMVILGTILFIGQFPVQFWVGVQRPDMLALAFSLVSLTIALTSNPKNISLLSVIMQATLISAAILVRQTCVVPVLIISLWYLSHKAYFKLFAFLSSLLIVISAVVFGLDHTSAGGYLWQQFILPGSIGKDYPFGFRKLISFVTAPITISSLVLWVLFYINTKDDRQGKTKDSGDDFRGSLYRNLLLIYTLFALLLAMITASRQGANINYYLEVAAAMSIVIPLYGAKMNQESRTKRIYPIILLIVGFSFSIRGMQVCSGEYYRWKSKGYYDEIVSVIKDKTKKEEPSYSQYPELITSAGRKYFFNDFVQYLGRAPQQHIIYNKVLESGKLAAIVTINDTPPIGYYRYKLSTPLPDRYFKTYLYLRNPSADSLSVKK